LKAWISQLLHEGYTKGSITVMIASVKSFFKYSDLPLGYIPMSKTIIVFHNRDITKEEIAKIIGASNRDRDRAFFAVMAQSGLRPHTLCLLRLKHARLDLVTKEKPACPIIVPQEIAKGLYRGHFTFIGSAAIKYLKDYLHGHRPDATPDSFLFTQHDTEKKLDRRTMSARFRNSILRLKKTGIIEYSQKQKTKPGSIRLYSLRKFFRKNNHAPDSYIQYWMGHVLKNQDEHYFPSDVRNLSEEVLERHRTFYMEDAMPYLVIETGTPRELEKTIEGQAKEIARLKAKLTGLDTRLIGYADTLEKLIEQREKELVDFRHHFLNEFSKNLVSKGVKMETIIAAVKKFIKDEEKRQAQSES